MDKNAEKTDAGSGIPSAPSAPSTPETTGDPRVDAVLAGLDRVSERPVAEHGALYAELHDGLLAALNEELSGERPPGSNPAVPGPGAGHRGQA
ncbi:hypothetical protein H9639_00020 [Arthrobacter sp. Sa2CUA1]|uniref:Uncharacterized protein n=1 Tax=Arthrobacter gallicola TaxID=2762225 RepID=A0ABR8UMC2_9MICC|nr:hypothetical protein [Arthrobacter gallicola]MBD7993693.1 hypothetical protein [Arthrobacter gallicola]